MEMKTKEGLAKIEPNSRMVTFIYLWFKDKSNQLKDKQFGRHNESNTYYSRCICRLEFTLMDYLTFGLNN